MNPTTPYTYVEMSLVVPWALYFVFLACVTLPFVVMIVGRGGEPPPGRSEGGSHRSAKHGGSRERRFVRRVLPLLLVVVFAVVALYVSNAFEVTHLMQTEKRAGPTLLSR